MEYKSIHIEVTGNWETVDLYGSDEKLIDFNFEVSVSKDNFKSISDKIENAIEEIIKAEVGDNGR